jgi:hypothetical protein
MAPTTTKQWVITSKDKDFEGLELQDAPIPELAENEILVLTSSPLTESDSLTCPTGGN